MILCVTLNPCLDKTLTVPSWKPGDLVRGTELRHVVGGKGNNVARALLNLGRNPGPSRFWAVPSVPHASGCSKKTIASTRSSCPPRRPCGDPDRADGVIP